MRKNAGLCGDLPVFFFTFFAKKSMVRLPSAATSAIFGSGSTSREAHQGSKGCMFTGAFFLEPGHAVPIVASYQIDEENLFCSLRFTGINTF